MALDVVSTPTIVERVPPDGRIFWAVNGYEADATTAIAIKAAPGAGKALYIRAVVITCDDDDCDPWLQDEDDNVLFGPILAKVAGPLAVVKEFSKPIMLARNKALEVKSSAAGTFTIWVEGATATLERSGQ